VGTRWSKGRSGQPIVGVCARWWHWQREALILSLAAVGIRKLELHVQCIIEVRPRAHCSHPLPHLFKGAIVSPDQCIQCNLDEGQCQHVHSPQCRACRVSSDDAQQGGKRVKAAGSMLIGDCEAFTRRASFAFGELLGSFGKD